MATKARKTPCADCKAMYRGSNATSWWCAGCGEWEVVNGRFVRP